MTFIIGGKWNSRARVTRVQMGSCCWMDWLYTKPKIIPVLWHATKAPHVGISGFRQFYKLGMVYL